MQIVQICILDMILITICNYYMTYSGYSNLRCGWGYFGIHAVKNVTQHQNYKVNRLSFIQPISDKTRIVNYAIDI